MFGCPGIAYVTGALRGEGKGWVPLIRDFTEEAEEHSSVESKLMVGGSNPHL